MAHKVIINPIIGPIVVASTTLILLAIFYLPSLSLNNQKEKITRESKEIVHHLKTFRSYCNEFVVSKVKNLPDIKVDYIMNIVQILYLFQQQLFIILVKNYHKMRMSKLIFLVIIHFQIEQIEF